mmetsp:Transcript_15778/g.36236  ORF Transcript_15778/g.36236 Transcript_15778/m.36236 type:complete len:207 (-) Transcript_15778:7-627(-)
MVSLGAPPREGPPRRPSPPREGDSRDRRSEEPRVHSRDGDSRGTPIDDRDRGAHSRMDRPSSRGELRSLSDHRRSGDRSGDRGGEPLGLEGRWERGLQPHGAGRVTKRDRSPIPDDQPAKRHRSDGSREVSRDGGRDGSWDSGREGSRDGIRDVGRESGREGSGDGGRDERGFSDSPRHSARDRGGSVAGGPLPRGGSYRRGGPRR